MAITQEVNIEMLEKLPDGNFKIKYPKTKAGQVLNLDKAAVGLSAVLNYGIATQAEAQAGTSNVKYMTPLRVLEAIRASVHIVEGSYIGNNTTGRKITLGFEPKLVIIIASVDSTSTPDYWYLSLGVIGLRYGGGSTGFSYNDSGFAPIITSDGFEIRGGNTTFTNANGKYYKYIALG